MRNVAATSTTTSQRRLTRAKRRELSRRADQLLARLRGTLVDAPPDATPKSCVVLLTERAKPVLVFRDRIQPTLDTIGLRIERLHELLTAAAGSPLDDGRRYPTLVMLDGWCQIAFVDCPRLSNGGDA